VAWRSHRINAELRKAHAQRGGLAHAEAHPVDAGLRKENALRAQRYAAGPAGTLHMVQFTRTGLSQNPRPPRDAKTGGAMMADEAMTAQIAALTRVEALVNSSSAGANNRAVA